MSGVADDVIAYLREFVADPPRVHRCAGANVKDPGERIRFEPGLSDHEFEAIQRRFGFIFAPDLRVFLSLGLAVNESFPNWRSGLEDDLRWRLDRPADGLCFHIQTGDFWFKDWGPQPDDAGEACALARERVAAAPTLIPIYGHRYIPAEPPIAGNPVFSVMASDIIVYGSDLRTYLDNEFGSGAPTRGQARRISLWTEIVEDY